MSPEQKQEVLQVQEVQEIQKVRDPTGCHNNSELVDNIIFTNSPNCSSAGGHSSHPNVNPEQVNNSNYLNYWVRNKDILTAALCISDIFRPPMADLSFFPHYLVFLPLPSSPIALSPTDGTKVQHITMEYS